MRPLLVSSTTQPAARSTWVTPIDADRAQVRFDAPQRDITAGQAAVFFQGDLLIGGGIIL